MWSIDSIDVHSFELGHFHGDADRIRGSWIEICGVETEVDQRRLACEEVKNLAQRVFN
jgi:hypothetical protein